MEKFKLYKSGGNIHYVLSEGILIYSGFSRPVRSFIEKLISLPAVIVHGDVGSDCAGRQLDKLMYGHTTAVPSFKLHAPNFRRLVLFAVMTIPHGETESYGKIADMIGHPGAGRAVGNALNRNPLPLIIPCHRILRSNGKLGGYAGGKSIKRKLLKREERNRNENPETDFFNHRYDRRDVLQSFY